MTLPKRGPLAEKIADRIDEIEIELKSYSLSDWERENLKDELRDLERDLKSLGY